MPQSYELCIAICPAHWASEDRPGHCCMAALPGQTGQMHMRSAADSPEVEVFRGARGPDPGSGLVKFHWEGISVMLAPVSQLIPPLLVAVLSAANWALAPATKESKDQHASSLRPLHGICISDIKAGGCSCRTLSSSPTSSRSLLSTEMFLRSPNL